MKQGKAAGPDEIPIEAAWKALGMEVILEREEIPPMNGEKVC